MAYISDYRDGTVSLTTGTKDLVGDGTAWASGAGIQTGDMLMYGGFVAIIETVIDDTHITLRDDWGGPTLAAGSSYSIKFSPDQSRVQASTVALINRLNSGSVDAFAQLTLEADRLPYANGPASMALTVLTAYGRGLLAAGDAAAVLALLGASDIGEALLTAANTGAAQDALGATVVGKAVLTAANEAAARGAIGATTIGQALLTAADAAAGRSAIGAPAAAVTVAVNAAQAFSAGEKTQARVNIGADDAANLTSGTLPDARVSATLTADKAFRRGNILGTVAQSGGVPTGAIVERGSNSNGSYVRFADGTQIAWQFLSGTANGTAGGATHSGNFAAAFATSPLPMALVATGFSSRFNCSLVAVSPTGIEFNASDNLGGNTPITLYYMAIGRWF